MSIMANKSGDVSQTIPDSLGDRVRLRREELKLTQTQLADLAGTRQQTIQKIEVGIIKRPRNLNKLAAALQKKPAWVQFGIEEIDDLDRESVILAMTWQGLPESLKEGFKKAIVEAAKINPKK